MGPGVLSSADIPKRFIGYQPRPSRDRADPVCLSLPDAEEAEDRADPVCLSQMLRRLRTELTLSVCLSLPDAEEAEEQPMAVSRNGSPVSVRSISQEPGERSIREAELGGL